MNPQNTTLGLHEPLCSKTLRVSDTVRLQISACLAPVTGKLGKPAHHGTEPGKSHFLFSDAPSPECQLHHYSLTCLYVLAAVRQQELITDALPIAL